MADTSQPANGGGGGDVPPRAPEAARKDPPPAEADSPSLRAGWLLRAAAIVGIVAAAAGVVVAPGMRGNASERVVVVSDNASAALAYLMCGLLVAVIVRGAFEALKNKRVAIGMRVVLVIGAGIVVAMSIPAIHLRLPPFALRIMVLAAIGSSFVGAMGGLKTPHTRAVSVALGIFALGALVRLGAWELASIAGERVSTSLFSFSRVLATLAVVLEALGQLTAAVWIGTRGRLLGQLLSSVAIAAAIVLTWGVAQGLHAHASFWQSVMHTALADAVGRPPPYGLGGVATFLVTGAILLALAAIVQPRQVATVVAMLALALLSRGAFDAPLRALSAVAVAQWLVVTMADERAMWRALIDTRKQRQPDA